MSRDPATWRRYRARHRQRVNAADRARSAKRSARTPEQIDADRARIHPDARKWCPACRARLPFEAFFRNRARADGLAAICRECFLAARHEREHTRP